MQRRPKDGPYEEDIYWRDDPREKRRRFDNRKAGENSPPLGLNIDRKISVNTFDKLVSIRKIHDFNYSKPLELEELNVLSKGLKFIPTRPKLIWSQVFEHFEVLRRNLQLKFFFLQEKNNKVIPRYRVSSRWEPPYDKVVDKFCFNFKNAIADLVENVQDVPRKQNLLRKESKVLSRLMKTKNKDSVIMTTDKHLGLSNTPKDQFVAEANLHLKDLDVYLPLDKNEGIILSRKRKTN
jgi:hypothetical protein